MGRKLYFAVFLIMGLSLAGNVVKADISDGLLAWHDFEDLLDGSGNDHDALLGGDAFIEDGLLWLDGAEDYADIGTLAGFGAVNPLVDALSDFTIAIAYASESTGDGEGGSTLVSVAPAGASASGDLSLGTNNDGQGIDHWYVGAVASEQSGVGYADGTVHLTIVTYEEASDTYTFYHLDGAGGAIDHGSGTLDWSGEWDESMDYGIRLGSPLNATMRADEGAGFFPDLDGQIDTFAIWNRVLDITEMPEIAAYRPSGEKATNPNPASESIEILRDAELNWTAGMYAQTHNVYFGTGFDDVNSADIGSDLLVSLGQTETSYDPEGLLGFGQAYYWRVDEINAAPDSTVFKGDVWSFTAEAFSYALTPMAATASSSHAENMGPEKTIDGSGLNELDQHSIDASDMWLSGMGDPQPSIQYEFDKIYRLHEMWVWNSNQIIESFLGLGAKDVVIETSTDGAVWTVLEGATLFNQATGAATYTANTVIDFAGALAKFVRITINAGYGMMAQNGFSEVRFFFIPTSAREPQPATDTEDTVGPDLTLTWRAGREAATHQVYLSTDQAAVMEGTAPSVSITEASFEPDDLVLNQTHFWRVDEVNEAATPQVWTGDLWSFTTPAFVSVDDFEGYSDDNENFEAIFQTWIDGLGYNEPVEKQGNGTGSIVGYAEAPFAEQDTVHDESGQSMPLEYDNSLQPFYSETERSFDEAQDWTRAGIKALTLYMYGDPENGSSDQLYVTLKDSQGRTATVAYDADPGHLTEPIWHEWNIDLQQFSGIDLTQVAGICLGVGDRGNPQPGGTGMLYIDNVRLYPSRCVGTQAPDGDVNGDCVVDQADVALVTANWLATPMAVEYTFDSGLADSSGNGRNGVGRNNPSVQNGVLTLNGSNFVDIPLGADNPFDGSRDFSIALDFKADMPSLLFSSARNAESDNHSMAIFVHHWNEPFWGEVIYDNFWVGASTAEDNPLDGEWHTVVVTYRAEDEWVTVYLDGVPGEGSEMNPTIPDIAADTVRIGGSLNDDFPYRDGVTDLDGAIDNVRIFNLALTGADVLRLPVLPTLPADVSGDGLVDQADQDLVEANLGAEQLWP